MRKRIISLALMLVFVITLFAGCGKVTDKNKNVVNGKFSDYLVAEKVGNLNSDRFTVAKGGLVYKGDNGLYGVASLNGIYDTGAIFGEVSQEDKYFSVREKAITSTDDIAGLNSAKLINGKGEIIVPDGYMAFNILNDRYIQVVTVDSVVYSSDRAVACRSEEGTETIGSFFEDNLYSGTWYIYDTVNKRKVPGISGDSYQIPDAYGQYVQYKDSQNNYVRADENGNQITDIDRFFEDGSYSKAGRVGEVYDSTGKLIFNYDLAGFVPSFYKDGYYVASKYDNGTSKYVVMDTSGKVISSEFEGSINIYGEIMTNNDKIYNLEGKNIIAGTYTSVCQDKMFKQYYMLGNDDYYTLIDKNGDVYFNGPEDKTHTVFTDLMLASAKKDDKTYYYSYKDQDYTIEGYSFNPWIVKTNNSNSLYDLVDTMTGNKLLEGYSNYSSVVWHDSTYYIYAEYNNGADIYLIEAASQLQDVTNKKEDLFDDLSAAFESEGIKVTVNKENGEIALDSSVLFGGDSAELTNDGKAFLNKFIKAYTTVAFSDKYNGFISKTMVEGHTAPVSGSTYASGLQLSEERANNVKNYCLSAETGVDVSKISDKLEGIGYSNSKPVYKDDGSVDMDASRRVSFRFIVNIDN